VIDSNSVLEPGVQWGNLQFFGSFDECLDIHIPESVSLTLSSRSMQYCTVLFPITNILGPDEVMSLFICLLCNILQTLSFKLKPLGEFYVQSQAPKAALCLPKACSHQTDLKIIIDKCKFLLFPEI